MPRPLTHKREPAAGISPAFDLVRASAWGLATLLPFTIIGLGGTAAFAEISRTELRTTFDACFSPSSELGDVVARLKDTQWQLTPVDDLSDDALDSFTASRLVMFATNTESTGLIRAFWQAERAIIKDTLSSSGILYTLPTDRSVLQAEWFGQDGAYSVSCNILLSDDALATADMALPFDESNPAPFQFLGKIDRSENWMTAVSIDPALASQALEHPFPFAALFVTFAP